MKDSKKKILGNNDLKLFVNQEVPIFYEWLGNVKFNELSSAEKVYKQINKDIVKFPISKNMSDFITDNYISFYKILLQNDTKIGELISKELYDQIIEKVIDVKILKNQIINLVVTSSIYSKTIADVLYHGIKKFVLTENIFLKLIPGASSILKFGQKAITKRLPKLEENIDSLLVDFINRNIKKTVSQSKKFLTKYLDEKILKQIIDDTWNYLARLKVSEIAAFTNEEQVKIFSEISISFFKDIRKTKFYSDTYTDFLKDFFDKHGNTNIKDFLLKLGITQKRILNHVNEFTLPIASKPMMLSYISQRISKSSQESQKSEVRSQKKLN